MCNLYQFIVGDLHGDLDQARFALQMAGVLSSDGEDLWTGGETVWFLSLQNSEKLLFISNGNSHIITQSRWSYCKMLYVSTWIFQFLIRFSFEKYVGLGSTRGYPW